MLTNESAASFETLALDIATDALYRFEVAALARSQEANSNGMLHSSRHLLQVDAVARDEMVSASAAVYEALLECHAAEPVTDVKARTAQLQAMLDASLDSLGQELTNRRDARTEPLIKALSRDYELRDLPQAIKQMRSKYKAKVQLKVAGIASEQKGASVANHISFVNSPVGVLQTGDHSTATVTQTISGPTKDELLTALQAISSAIDSAQSLRQHQRDDAQEMIEDLRSQANRDAPNNTKLGALLTVLATTVQTIPNAAPAWAVLQQWGAMLGLGGQT